LVFLDSLHQYAVAVEISMNISSRQLSKSTPTAVIRELQVFQKFLNRRKCMKPQPDEAPGRRKDLASFMGITG
jgi:hypothetical protein